ncbi:MAG: hypothetical protein MUO87_08045, partial [Thermoplasmata archaeon]|nr:hypothetical protein [Thermoplasmata archaeon]
IKGKPSGTGGGSPVAPVRKTGEDFVRVYIDADIDPATGYPVSISSKVIGAEYMIEVVGQFGEVVSESLYAYDGTWAEVSGVSIDAEKDLQRMEIGVSVSALGGDSAIDFIVETTDWKGRVDVAASDDFLMSAVSGGLIGDSRRWVVDSSSTSRFATSMSYQRKMFYDGTNFWSLYWDGSNTVYKYSSDGGVTWVSKGSVFPTTAGMNKTSIWYNASAQQVYVVGDSSLSTKYVTMVKGTVDPATAEITWGNEKLNWISSYPTSEKNAFICQGLGGYVWVVGTSRVHDTNEQWQLRTNQSANPADVEGAWNDRGNLLAGWSSASNAKGLLLPAKAGSGSAVWVIYSYEGNVDSKTHLTATSAWSSPDVVFKSVVTMSTQNTEYAPASALIDENGVVHVVYGTGHMSGGGVWGGHIEYSYNQGSGWAGAYPLDEAGIYGTRSPTISLDSSTGNVFAMWLQNTTDNILIEKNVTSSWSTVSIDQTSYVKSYLTSIYNATGETYICFQWTQNTTTSDIDVLFDKIPEFTDTFIPVLFILTLFAVYRSRARRMGPGKDCDEAGDDGL